MSAGPDGRGGDLARRRVRRLRRRPRRSGRARRGAAGPVLELGCGTGRVALHLAARATRSRRSTATPSLLDALDAARPRERGLAVETRRAPTFATSTLDRRLRADHRADAARSTCSAARRARRDAARVSPPPRARRPRSPPRCSPRSAAERRARPAPPLPDVREVDGWVYSSLPLEVRRRRRRLEIRRLRQLVSPAGELERGARRRSASTTLDARPARARGRARPGCVAVERIDDRRPPTTTSARSIVVLEACADGAAPARALPRADEHLRRPRQHHLPAAALRVARDRLLLRRRRARRGLRPGRPRPDLHRRRPGPRPGARRRGHAAAPSARRSPRRSTTAPCVLAVCGGYQLLGHSYQLGDERIAGPRPGRPRDGPRAGPAADRQRRDRGRPRRRPAGRSPASRTTAGAPTSAPTPSRSAG